MPQADIKGKLSKGFRDNSIPLSLLPDLQFRPKISPKNLIAPYIAKSTKAAVAIALRKFPVVFDS